jgi:glycosyltransferase involved in cell wall biosynthesis
VILQDHADRLPPGWRLRAYRRAVRDVAAVLFTAAEQARPFLEGGALAAALPVFEVLESTSRFTPAPRHPEPASAEIRGDPCLLWVGRLDANKDPLTVLDAFAAAAGELPGARLWMCYREAPLLAEVRARVARDPTLAGRVELIGARSHEGVERLLRAADFLVLGSRREGSGYSVLEALACGATPLVTDIPSFRRITGGGAVGALSPPGDARAMAAAMTAFARLERAQLRAAARAHFERHLSLTAIAEQLRAAYGSVLRTTGEGSTQRGPAA